MKKLLLVLSIVFFLLSCDDAGMENQDNSQETSQVELKEPKPVTNVRHTQNGDVYTVTFDHDGDGVIEIHVGIGCNNGTKKKKKEYLRLTPDIRKFSFDNDDLNSKIPCTHTNCKEIYAQIYVHYDTKKYSSFSVRTLYSIDYN
jgi:hypothetical protein